MLKVPEWKGELLFSKEVVVFLGVILLMLVGTLFCFWGYKYFRTILFLGIGIAACYCSYLLVEPMTASLVIRMFLTVSLTFLGVCFAYFLDIIFGYLLDRFRVRGALGKRTYLIAAPLGAAILGLTVYYFIWRDAVVALVIALCCLVPGLIFQHHKKKTMVRFRCYNDLLRLRRPKLEPVPVMAAEPEPEPIPKPEPVPEPAAEPEPEPIPEPEPVPVPAAEPEPEPIPEPEPVPVPAAELEPIFEPEPVFMMNAQQQALSEIESEFAAESGYEPETWFEDEPVEAKPAAGETAAPAAETESISETPEDEEEPVSIEISDSVKELLLRKMESDEELLEEAFFVKKVSEKMAEKQSHTKKKAEKQSSAVSERKADGDIRIERISPVYPGRITIAGKDRKSRRKRAEGRARAAVIAAAGLGAFIAGRISKGGD